ncbi:PQQ-binding-like beta-propeller repeat protein [bacterium]|nr:PQQ-binding-like beta-propeller repeat protein [bacterium]
MRYSSISRRAGLIGVLLVLFVASTAIAGDAPLLFSLKLKKPITNIYTIGEDADKLFLHNKSRLFMYDGNKGNVLWEAEVPKATDDGLNMVWNDTYYIASMKKGMIAFNLSDGSEAWKTDRKMKMNEFYDYYNFPTGFILTFEDVILGFDPNSGEVKWTQEEFGYSNKLWQNGLETVFSYERPYGNRLLLLGEKSTYLYSAETGKILGKVPVSFSGNEGEDPVLEISENLLGILCKDGTVAIDLETGGEVWRVDYPVDPDYGYEVFEHDSGKYALLNYKKGFTTLDLLNGDVLWSTDDDTEVTPVYQEVYEDGTLALIAFKSKAIGLGSAFFGYGFDLMTGEKKYGPLPIIWSGAASAFGQMQAAIWPVKVMDEEIILLTFGASPYKIEDDPSQTYGMNVAGRHPNGSEGFVRYNMKTGELKYRTDLVLFDNWSKHRRNAAYGRQDPGAWVDTNVFPHPVLDNDGNAYIVAEPGAVKVDLETGETIWSSPDYEHTGYLNLCSGKLVGTIGYAQFRWITENQKAKDATLESKKHGFFMLDAATGEELWTYPGKVKDPLGSQFTYFDKETKAYYLSNGETLQRINIPEPGVAWELDFKKDLTGRIEAGNAIAFVLTGISGHQSGDYMITEKTYSVQHALYVDWLGDGKMMVRGPDGPALLDLDGNVLYTGDWKWNPSKMNLIPTNTLGGMLYQYKDKLRMVSLEDGSQLWESKEKLAKEADLHFTDNMGKLFVVGDKSVTCYKID